MHSKMEYDRSITVFRIAAWFQKHSNRFHHVSGIQTTGLDPLMVLETL